MADRRLLVGASVVAALVAAGAYYGLRTRAAALPADIATGNGRLEAQEVHVASKAGGRVVEVAAKEGDFVKAGDLLARLDSDELKAALARALAAEAGARETVAEAKAAVAQQASALKLAKTERDRARSLLAGGSVTAQEADRRESEYQVAVAARAGGTARLAAAERGVEAAKAEADRVRTLLAETEVRAPVAGRVQYRLAEPGEVLGPGGRVATLLDLENVFMTVFLPTAQAGKVVAGAPGRLVLDAYPEFVIPAAVTFVANEAQFTPREVETRSEREKLMFRVKVRVDPELARKYAGQVRVGLPGTAFVALSPDARWPERLTPKVPR